MTVESQPVSSQPTPSGNFQERSLNNFYMNISYWNSLLTSDRGENIIPNFLAAANFGSRLAVAVTVFKDWQLPSAANLLRIRKIFSFISRMTKKLTSMIKFISRDLFYYIFLIKTSYLKMTFLFWKMFLLNAQLV